MKLYCHTGSRLTIIPTGLYNRAMGEIKPAKYRLRAWGSRKALDVKGMFRATIQTVSGARKRTWVYMVDGI